MLDRLFQCKKVAKIMNCQQMKTIPTITVTYEFKSNGCIVDIRHEVVEVAGGSDGMAHASESGFGVSKNENAKTITGVSFPLFSPAGIPFPCRLPAWP
jgi:hypothetical protein